MYMYVCMYVRMYVCRYVRMYVCIYVNIDLMIYTYRGIHISNVVVRIPAKRWGLFSQEK